MTSPPPPAIVDGVDDYVTAMARSRRLGSEFTRRFSTRRKEVMAAILKVPSEESVIRITANTLPPKPQVGGYVLLAAILGSSMAFLDGSVASCPSFATGGSARHDR
jgi:hypothetical protein